MFLIKMREIAFPHDLFKVFFFIIQRNNSVLETCTVRLQNNSGSYFNFCNLVHEPAASGFRWWRCNLIVTTAKHLLKT